MKRNWSEWLPPRDIPCGKEKVTSPGQVWAFAGGGEAGVVRVGTGDHMGCDHELLASNGSVSAVPGHGIYFMTRTTYAVLIADVGCEPTPPHVLYGTPTPGGGTVVPVVGRFPPAAGDVWLSQCDGELTFDGLKLDHPIFGVQFTAVTTTGAHEPRGEWSFPHRGGLLIFVRHAATPSPSPVAQRIEPHYWPVTPVLMPTVAHAGHRTFRRGCNECEAAMPHIAEGERLRAQAVAIQEQGQGIAGKTLPPARHVFVSKVDDWDLLEDVGARSWRSR